MITIKINENKLLWVIGFVVQGLLISTVVICSVNYFSGHESVTYYGDKIWCVPLWEGGERCFNPSSPFITGGIFLPLIPLGAIIGYELLYLNSKYKWFKIIINNRSES